MTELTIRNEQNARRASTDYGLKVRCAKRDSRIFETLIDAVQHRSSRSPQEVCFTYLEDGENETAKLTFEELDARARCVAAAIQQKAQVGDRALLLFPPGLDYIIAFLGCLYSGVLAVPAYPPEPSRLKLTIARLKGIAIDCRPKLALTLGAFVTMGQAMFQDDDELSDVEWLSTDSVNPEMADMWSRPNITSDSVAFLQYTSGSTASPKGVMVTHGNLLYNLADLRISMGESENNVLVHWLPTFHDMGLIFGLLQPIVSGYACYMMSPMSFLQRPYRWLKALSHYRATLTAAPNFAYDLCVKKTTPEQRSTLDLSSLRGLMNGAEPVRKETLTRFAETFGACGFRFNALGTGYGLAEATLKVTSADMSAPPLFRTVSGPELDAGRVRDVSDDAPDARTLVGCGRTLLDTHVIIVDPSNTEQIGDDLVGEIWISGPSVAAGYWQRPDESQLTFRAHTADGNGPYLKTGDLGFLKNGELFVTGRIKDMIIVDGQNRYPQDIEWSVQDAHKAIRPGCCAAFSIEENDAERLIIIAEVDRRYLPRRNGASTSEVVDPKELEKTLRKAVAEAHDLRIHAIRLIKHGTVPKTSSGKIQRHACRQAFLSGNLDLWEN